MPCQEPLFPEPHAPRGREGTAGSPRDPPSSLGAAPSPEPAAGRWWGRHPGLLRVVQPVLIPFCVLE